MNVNKESLERLYAKYNCRRFVHPDPLEFLYRYDDPADREIAGLIASSLAYGRVAQILKSVGNILDPIQAPAEFLKLTSPAQIKKEFRFFKHRFSTGSELSRMLIGIKRVFEQYGSLNECFLAGSKGSHKIVPEGLVFLVQEIANKSGGDLPSLLPNPEKCSACKRLHLFLRWMVRRDEVDPGGWSGVPASALIVPLDTHMHRICRALGLTNRKQADLRTAMAITEAFRSVSPDDPVRYDFALTRLGIRRDADFEKFLLDYRSS